jgi:precorrin-2 dehydrogenase/sirohydrochlorin ferrochelatase
MKKSKKAGFYPVLINLQRFKCIVVGGGKVAHRKVLSLLNFGGEITVISPKITKPILELAKKYSIRLINTSYSKKYINGSAIVFSATDNTAINRRVRKDCSDKGILLNVADDPDLCDFILPANIIRGDLTVAVSSQGKAPFMTKKMKSKIDEFIPPIYTDIFMMGAQLRKQILNNSSIDSKTRAMILKKFASMNWEKILSGNGRKSSKDHLQEVLHEFKLK